ncbi:MAG: translation elongation factor Ts [Paracoccaceae bacterium]|nr:translation elongation factor Ts [Paracoccaceae bacterium]
MAITAALVKELRDKTGAGMMDAKKALTESDGDMEAAVDWLRTKGLAKAAKKSGRTAAEGLIGVATSGGLGVAVEVNSETDFVARNAEFQEMVQKITEAALQVSDVEALTAAMVGDKTVAEYVTDKVATIGEHMTVRRMAVLNGAKITTYIHNPAATDMGSIGVLVAYDGGDDDFARGVAMHIAAINPASLSEADLDPAIVEKEKAIQMDIARESGKPEAVIEKMIGGRMQKWLSEVTLLNQVYVKSEDGKTTVGDAAKAAGVEITGFVRLEVGEGIEVEKEDFAAEVAKAAQG